jgi:hypothetical protein
MADDTERRKKARVPEEIEFKTKPQIALDQLRALPARPAYRAVSCWMIRAAVQTLRCAPA